MEIMSKFEQECKDEFSFSKNNDNLLSYGMGIYSNFIPQYENVGDDNHRPFLVEFDSLLLDLFHSPLIDITNGPQV